MYGVRLHTDVVKFIERLDDKTQKHIKEKLKVLRSEPRRSRGRADIKKLSGTKGRQDLYRLRIGKYRFVYAVEEDMVWVTDAFMRERGYRNL